ncbi:alpha-D-ribose 1-methylphosphonate 5-triphosphate diphosphatase [Halalkalirubrum salinum]|uniref:alpha-D-ribose 1-methylphosphonate 5-triphosphate diphosphatase n=1 Tax=Halalkalirubrum salinum TaxID=2563889 RepID=UPI0010FB2FE2|nr:alpha-D-ribose 1-methylphosphonate 5-triphosphate diphosphatase [Halalkalirubrum salinum]
MSHPDYPQNVSDRRREPSSSAPPVELRHGRVVTPETVISDGCVLFSGGTIVDVGPTTDPPRSGAASVDVSGAVVMPGIVDLHGDDIESERNPRSSAQVSIDTALLSTDRINALNGITTKFHAIAFEETPEDNRSISEATELARSIKRTDGLLVDNRVHARCELSCPSVDAVAALVNEGTADLVSIMHHGPDEGQFDDASFRDHYINDRNVPREAIDDLIADRRTVSEATLTACAARAAEVAESAGVPLASHDDNTVETVEWMDRLDVDISEFPLTLAAADRAKACGMTTALGAPNLIRGGSLWDNLSVRDAIEAGVCNVLCSDYHPPSMLASPFVETGEPLSTRVARVTKNPADAVGLTDRGRIEPGARADVLVVDLEPAPTVQRAYVNGIETLRTGAQATGSSTVRGPAN